MQIYQYYNMII